MADFSNRLTLEQLQATEEYQRLTKKQRLWVSTYCAGGLVDGDYDPIAATRTAYECKTPEIARIMSYSITTSPKIIAVLNRHFGRTPTEEFLQQLDRAINNKHVTIAQVELLKTKCRLLGIPNGLPNYFEGHQDELPKEVREAHAEARKKKNAGKEKKRPGPKPKEDHQFGFEK